MREIVTLAVKDLRLLLRDRFGLFWVLVFPLLMALFFGAIFSGSGGSGGRMRIAVVDHDASEGSVKFVETLKSSASLDVLELSAEEAEEAVRKGKLAAFVALKKGFGNSNMFSSGGDPLLQIGMDPSRKTEAGYLEGILNQGYFRFMFDRYSEPERIREQLRGLPEEIADSADLPPDQRDNLSGFIASLDSFLANIDTGIFDAGRMFQGVGIERIQITRTRVEPRSSFEITFPQAIAWGLIGCTAAFSITIVIERTGGTFLRLRFAPISRAQILAGKALACFTACTSVTVFLLIVGRSIFAVRLQNPLHLTMAILCTAACFVGIMMFISVLGKTEQGVGGAGWAILLVMSMFGGGMIPLMAMPPWMKWGSALSPVKWGILSIEGAVWRGFTIREMMFPCLVLLGIGTVFYTVGVLVFRRSDI